MKFSCEIAHYGKSLISAFHGFFASIGKIFILAGCWALGYHSMGLEHFPVVLFWGGGGGGRKSTSLKSFGQLVYAMFISNYCASLHL